MMTGAMAFEALAQPRSGAVVRGLSTARVASSPARVAMREWPDAGPILVVEADTCTAGVFVEQLRADGYAAELASSSEHARVLARRCPPRLVVLGGLAAPRDALELLEEIRGADCAKCGWAREMPVIVLGARAEELDMLRAFEAGADDFIVQPARYLELRARMRALLRRVERTAAPAHRLTVGPLAIDMDAHAVSLHERPVDLRRLEYELLVHLASDPVRVFGKQELLRGVWGYRASGSTRTVDSHASRLRRKLEESDRGRWVINVWGVGYRLV